MHLFSSGCSGGLRGADMGDQQRQQQQQRRWRQEQHLHYHQQQQGHLDHWCGQQQQQKEIGCQSSLLQLVLERIYLQED